METHSYTRFSYTWKLTQFYLCNYAPLLASFPYTLYMPTRPSVLRPWSVSYERIATRCMNIVRAYVRPHLQTRVKDLSLDLCNPSASLAASSSFSRFLSLSLFTYIYIYIYIYMYSRRAPLDHSIESSQPTPDARLNEREKSKGRDGW